MNKHNDMTYAFSFLAWEAINNLETYCPEKLGDLKQRMKKVNDEWLRLSSVKQNPEYQLNTPAYAKGFLDGYEQGIDNNEYEDNAKRTDYKHGYEAGVAYYCAETHPEDENQ